MTSPRLLGTLKLQEAGIVSRNVTGNLSGENCRCTHMTIKDIARECGVSVSTVSRVLNKHPDVSEAVRCKVMRVVEERGYIPNNSARDLVRSSSDAVGVIVRGTGNLFFSSMIKTISRELEARGYTMVLHFIDTDADEVKAGAVLEREKKLQGLLFLGGRFDYNPAELSLVNVPKQEALYVGDSEVDFKTASNACVNFRILTTGTRSKESLLESGVPEAALIDSLYSVRDLL